ncbi:hypothetical protein Tco_0801022 [Tanacetum coccineum]|uniref:Uncharacterized protein n=1 Tax=Tanacetum coccineum TaxID=301880 RepID=A0ABQ4ZUU0_9ASTR
MAGSLFNKFKGDEVKVLLLRELREMLQVQGKTMQLIKQVLLSVITVRDQLAFLAAIQEFPVRQACQNQKQFPKQNAAFQD